jgi:hypothetical protein
MNVKSCLKVNNGLLYRTVSLKLQEVRLYTTKGGARQLRVSCCAASLACTHRQVVPFWLQAVREVIDPRRGGEGMHRT